MSDNPRPTYHFVADFEEEPLRVGVVQKVDDDIDYDDPAYIVWTLVDAIQTSEQLVAWLFTALAGVDPRDEGLDVCSVDYDGDPRDVQAFLEAIDDANEDAADRVASSYDKDIELGMHTARDRERDLDRMPALRTRERRYDPDDAP